MSSKETEQNSEAARRRKAAAWKTTTGLALGEIRRLIRTSGVSQRKIEERAGFSKGYISQLLAKNLDLKMWHVLAILDALGENPGGFFKRVYPRPRRTSALERFRESSEPLTEEVDEVLGRLYKTGVESLDELRGRLARCERAVSHLEALGVLEERWESKG